MIFLGSQNGNGSIVTISRKLVKVFDFIFQINAKLETNDKNKLLKECIEGIDKVFDLADIFITLDSRDKKILDERKLIIEIALNHLENIIRNKLKNEKELENKAIVSELVSGILKFQELKELKDLANNTIGKIIPTENSQGILKFGY